MTRRVRCTVGVPVMVRVVPRSCPSRVAVGAPRSVIDFLILNGPRHVPFTFSVAPEGAALILVWRLWLEQFTLMEPADAGDAHPTPTRRTVTTASARGVRQSVRNRAPRSVGDPPIDPHSPDSEGRSKGGVAVT